jgi:hypothetical protein
LVASTARSRRPAVRHLVQADGAVTHDADRHLDRLPGPDALQHGVGAVAAGQLADPFDALGTALGHDVGGAELAAQVGAQHRVRHVFHPDVAGAVHQRCSHESTKPQRASVWEILSVQVLAEPPHADHQLLRAMRFLTHGV